MLFLPSAGHLESLLRNLSFDRDKERPAGDRRRSPAAAAVRRARHRRLVAARARGDAQVHPSQATQAHPAGCPGPPIIGPGPRSRDELPTAGAAAGAGLGSDARSGSQPIARVAGVRAASLGAGVQGSREGTPSGSHPDRAGAGSSGASSFSRTPARKLGHARRHGEQAGSYPSRTAWPRMRRPGSLPGCARPRLLQYCDAGYDTEKIVCAGAGDSESSADHWHDSDCTASLSDQH